MATSSPTRDYDGTGDYLDTNDASTYDFTTGTKVFAAWIFADTNSSRRAVMGNMDGGSPEDGWGWYHADASGAHMDVVEDSNIAAVSSITPGTGVWLGLAVVWKMGGTEVDFYQLEADGTLTTDTVTFSGNPTASTGTLRIGVGGLSTLAEFDGALNYAQIFTNLKNANQIQCALWSPGSVVNNLEGLWPAYGQLDPEPDLSKTDADAAVVGTGGTRTEACPAIPQQMPIM